MMFEVLLRLPLLGYSMATAGVRPDFSQRSFLRDLGFIEHSKAIAVKDTQTNFEGIPICLKYIDKYLIKEKYLSHIDALNKKNVIVKSDLIHLLSIAPQKSFRI